MKSPIRWRNSTKRSIGFPHRINTPKTAQENTNSLRKIYGLHLKNFPKFMRNPLKFIEI
jgi:hypothetical protein